MQCLWILEPHDHLHISHDSKTTSRVAEAIGAQIDLFGAVLTASRQTEAGAHRRECALRSGRGTITQREKKRRADEFPADSEWLGNGADEAGGRMQIIQFGAARTSARPPGSAARSAATARHKPYWDGSSASYTCSRRGVRRWTQNRKAQRDKGAVSS